MYLLPLTAVDCPVVDLSWICAHKTLMPLGKELLMNTGCNYFPLKLPTAVKMAASLRGCVISPGLPRSCRSLCELVFYHFLYSISPEKVPVAHLSRFFVLKVKKPPYSRHLSTFSFKGAISAYLNVQRRTRCSRLDFECSEKSLRFHTLVKWYVFLKVLKEACGTSEVEQRKGTTFELRWVNIIHA